MESVHELTLEWMDAGQTWSQIIRPQQPTKFPGRVRIGRDSAQCDIVLSNSTVSALHVEVFFDPQQQRFMMRNLRENNLPYVDGQPLLQGERVLNQGNVLRLGEVELRVGSIALKQYPVGSVPSGSFSTPQPSSPQPVAATVQTGRSSSSPKMAANEYVTNISSKSSSSGSTPVNPPKPPKKISRLWSGLIVALIVGGSAAYRSYNSFQLRQIAKGKEAEAKLYVPVMTRAQQAFFFEKGYFASLTELNSDGLNIREQTVNYRYRVASVSTTKTMVSGIALKEGLRSFVGIVWREPPNTEGESDTRGVICESVTTEEPSLPETNDCPSGFSRIEAVRGVDESGVFNK
jgi:pSer/pThr/pTyr-binding forkhead associated (FHA) protein